MKQTEEGGASDGDPTDAADQRDTAHRVEPEQPPSKKTAQEELFGPTFSEPPVIQSKSRIEVEIDVYKKDTSISLISCPLKWWKENAQMYPLLSRLAKAYLTVPATSVPSERVFFYSRGYCKCTKIPATARKCRYADFLAKKKKPVSNLNKPQCCLC